MNNSIAQFLSVLGGSTNPSLFGQGEASLNSGNPQFRSMLVSQFSGQVITDGEANENRTQNIAGQNAMSLLGRKSNPENESASQIWQIINANAQNDTGKNSLVLQLSQQGVDQDTIDGLVNALEKSDLITILKDPSLAEQLTNIATDTNLPSDSGEMNSFVQSIINKFVDEQNSKTPLTVDIVDMDMDEFKEWKKANFVDLAAFLSTEKTKVGANGEIIKILQGPAFLAEDGKPSEKIVDIIPFDREMTLEEFIALQQFQPTSSANQQVSEQAAPFTPISLNMVYQALLGSRPTGQATTTTAEGTATTGQVTPLESGLENGEAMVADIGVNSIDNRPVGTAAIMNASAASATSQSTMRNAAALGSESGGTRTQANSHSMLTPFMTPAEMSGLITDGDGYTAESGMLPFEAAFKTASHAANPILTQPSAGQPHPATQMVAISMQRVANTKGGDDADVQKYRLQLDPPEMGRVDIELEFDAGNKVKAMIVADKPETLQLLQRDSHALMKALQDAGFDGVGDNNLQFNLSQNQNDSAGQGGHNSNQNQNGQNALLSGELETENTEMSMIVDPVTGQQRINMVV